MPVGPAPALLDPRQVKEIAFHRGPPPGDREPVSVTGWGKTQNVEGTKPSALKNIANADMQKKLLRQADYAKWSKEFVNTK